MKCLLNMSKKWYYLFAKIDVMTIVENGGNMRVHA